MWIVCLADNLHEMLSFIFPENDFKNMECRMLQFCLELKLQIHWVDENILL